MKALAIIDAQNDFINGNLGVGLNKWNPAKNEILKLINSGKYDVLIYTKDWHPKNHCSFIQNGGKWVAHCIQTTKGAEIDKELDFSKTFTGKTEILLKGISSDKEEYGIDLANEEYGSIDIVGLCYDYCVADCAKITSESHKNIKVNVIKEGTVAIDEKATPDFGLASVK